jgi:hypothetical protein
MSPLSCSDVSEHHFLQLQRGLSNTLRSQIINYQLFAEQ